MDGQALEVQSNQGPGQCRQRISNGGIGGDSIDLLILFGNVVRSVGNGKVLEQWHPGEQPGNQRLHGFRIGAQSLVRRAKLSHRKLFEANKRLHRLQQRVWSSTLGGEV